MKIHNYVKLEFVDRCNIHTHLKSFRKDHKHTKRSCYRVYIT